VRLPDYGVFHVQRITTNQGSIVPSVASPILWNSSSTIGNAVGTLNTTTGAITLNRGGKFRIEGFISYQNSGATTRYLVTIVTVSGTILQVFPANCTGIGVGANNVSLNYFSFYIQTSGTAIFTTNITPSAGTAQINAMSNVAATASTTCMTITEIG
jgi:hypothetical protein